MLCCRLSAQSCPQQKAAAEVASSLLLADAAVLALLNEEQLPGAPLLASDLPQGWDSTFLADVCSQGEQWCCLPALWQVRSAGRIKANSCRGWAGRVLECAS